METTTFVETLQSALSDAEAFREAELQAVRQRYDGEINRLRGAIQALGGELPPTVLVPLGLMDRRPETALSVGEDKIAAVLRCVKKHPNIRQADIAKTLGFNSGTVSVALRRLALEPAEIEAGPKKDGSTTWRAIQATKKRHASGIKAAA